MHFPPTHKSTPAEVSHQKHQLVKEAVPWQASACPLPVAAHLAGCNPCSCLQFLQLCLLAAPLQGCHALCREKLCQECSAESPSRAPSEPMETPGHKGALQRQVSRAHLEIRQQQHSLSLPASRISTSPWAALWKIPSATGPFCLQDAQELDGLG